MSETVGLDKSEMEYLEKRIKAYSDYMDECDKKGLYIHTGGGKVYFERLLRYWEEKTLTLESIQHCGAWKSASPKERKRVAKLLPYTSPWM